MDAPPQPDRARSNPHAGRATRRAGVAVAAVAAVGVIGVGDRMIRARQDLAGAIARQDVRVILPFNEYLTERVEKRRTWDRLHADLAARRAAGDTAGFVKAGYELERFMAGELGPDDARRRRVLLDMVGAAPRSPDVVNAYWSLLLPEWAPELRPQYPQYADAVTRIALGWQPQPSPELLFQLAVAMREVGEPGLRLAALRDARRVSPVVTLRTLGPMRELAELLPPGDERRAVEADVAAYEARREQVVASAQWYAELDRAIAKLPADQRAAEIERRLARAPRGAGDAPPASTAPAGGGADVYRASAEARLADAYLLTDRWADAAAARRRLAGVPLTDADFEDATDVAVELNGGTVDAAPARGAATRPGGGAAAVAAAIKARNAAAKKAGAPPASAPIDYPAPDVEAVYEHRWRGLLAARRLADADAVAAVAFGDAPREVKDAAAAERALAAGEASRLAPAVVLAARTTGLPPELAGAAGALYGRFELVPAGKGVDPSAKAVAEFWMTDDRVLVTLDATEPRRAADVPKPLAKGRDGEVWRDEAAEFFFDPDRWFDTYLQLDVNPAGTVYDARITNTGSTARRAFRADSSGFDLAARATAEPTPGGWRARAVFPRSRVWPTDARAIRFNARRLRQVVEKGQKVTHVYTWSPKVTDVGHRPDQLGWLILPAGAK